MKFTPLTTLKEDRETLSKLTKQSLINVIFSSYDEIDLQRSEINHVKIQLERTELRLEKAESYVEQGRGIINSIMDKWYHYE